MNTKIKDRIKGYSAFTFCVSIMLFLFLTGTTQAQPVQWHIILLPLLPPIVYPTW